MGMSASQVRFLSLQHRKNNIGRQLTTLSNRKMSLSRDMNQVAKNYNNALNQISLKWSNNCGVDTYKLTYDLMMSPNELNTETPYIVTDRATGRVVLNNDQITDFEGNAIFDTDGNAVTYVDLAKMISSYVTCNDNSTVIIDPSFVTSADGSVYDPSKECKTIAEGLVYANKNIDLIYGESAVDGTYYIPKSSSDFDFDNNLRYSIFTKLGLVSEGQKAKQMSLLKALYGSEEAQETGKYPVGSAWGDYYIAVANREAYKDFLKTDQKLAISSATNGSQNTTRHYTYMSNDYIYNTEVNGSDGHSEIVYSSSTALDRVDFKAITTTNSDGLYVTTYEGESGWTGLKQSTYDNEGNMYDTFHEDAHEASGSGKAYTDTYKIDVSENGITYTNYVDDIINKAIVNQGSVIADRADNAEHKADAYYGFISDGNSASIALGSNVNAYYLGEQNASGRMSDALRPQISSIKSYFKSCLENQGIAVNESALTKAEAQTLERFKDFIDEDTDSCSTQNRACQHTQDKTVGFINRQQWHLDWSGWFPSTHQAFTSYAVDPTSLFTCFVTYYQQELLGDTVGSTVQGLNPDNPTLNTKQMEGTTSYHIDEMQNTSTAKTYYQGGAKFTNSDGKTVIQVTRQEAEKVSSSYVLGYGNCFDAGTVFYSSSKANSQSKVYETLEDGTVLESYVSSLTILQSDSTVIPASAQPSGTIAYKLSQTSSTLTYFEDKSGYTWNGGTVFGTVQGPAYEGADGKYYAEYYYFTSQTQLNNYINTGSLSGVPSTTAEATSGGGTVTFGEDSNNEGIVTTIKNTRSSSTLAISLDGKVAEDDAYMAKLDLAVDKAMERIKQLETDLDEFYQGADKKMMDYYDALFMKIAQCGWMLDDCTSSGTNYAAGAGQTAYVHAGNKRSAEYLNNKLQNNDYFITECAEKGNKHGYKYTAKQATSIMKIYQVHDSDAENAALAKYETEKAAISAKEKQIDSRMIKLETEQEAINTELDSIKKVRNDNIEKYFKIFA